MKYPGAIWRGPVPNMTPGGIIEVRGLILHRMQGTLRGTDSWFKNPRADASSHWGLDHQDGELFQWVDTADRAWTQGAGNPRWLSVEISGYVGDPVSPVAQRKLGELWKWVVDKHGGVPNQITNSPSGRGLGWHGMGANDGWGHPDCPGAIVKNLRPYLISLARPEPEPEEEDMPLNADDKEFINKAIAQGVWGRTWGDMPGVPAMTAVDQKLDGMARAIAALRAELAALKAQL